MRRTESPEKSFKQKREKTRGRLGEIIRVLLRNKVQSGLSPDKLCRTLEDLGPTFVKLGQILSSRPDILPKEYCLGLESLRTNVSPLEFSEVKTALAAELGRPPEEVFSHIYEKPLGSASIAQAHYAVTRSGERVVLKVQRPAIREKMLGDLSLLKRASGILRVVSGVGSAVDFDTLLDEMETVTAEELDFRLEAANLTEFAVCNRGVRYARCPKVFDEFTTERLVVMEYVEGIRIDDLVSLKKEGYDCAEIGAKLADNYIKQITEDGFFHADPHAGNLLVSGDKIVWIDLGMMGRITSEQRRLLKEGISAVLDHDCLKIKNVLLAIGKFEGADDAGLYQDIDRMLNRYGNMGVGDFDMGRILNEFLDLANENSVSLPTGLTMFARGILTMESVISTLAPELNIMEMFRSHMKQLIKREFDFKHELTRRGLDVYRMTDKLAELPSDLSQYLKMSIAGVSTVNVELASARRYQRELFKFTVRIVLSILCAALLISAGLFAQTDILGRVLGMSTFSFIEIVVSVVLGLGIVLSFLIKRRPRKFFRRKKKTK